MSWQVWTTIGAWLLVTAVALAAHLFGREARTLPKRCASPEALRRARLGVALSITGPLLAYAAGLVVAAVTGQWAVVGLATVLLIIGVAATGLFLAPH
ncbi:hypothetical protein [Blastococcus sp. Marseille-P5729]|uniref:hypothetical protein n=1 Tax=Blastococcus sp. Marseille-P5729 TaxID=2086582 RepID=UPI000D0ED475|nr:hypothetical protein [Blastococcus sp. Marseille-P5729]